MTSIPEIRFALLDLSDPELRALCLEIVDRVTARIAQGSEGIWTLGVIAGWLERDSADPALARSVQLLATKRDSRLFDIHYLYFDPAGTYPCGAKITDDEVREAYATGFLVDPDTGEEIRAFEDVLEPYFVPASALSGASYAS